MSRQIAQGWRQTGAYPGWSLPTRFRPPLPRERCGFRMTHVAGERVGVRGPHRSLKPPHPGPLPHSQVFSESNAQCGGEGAEPGETPCENPSRRCTSRSKPIALFRTASTASLRLGLARRSARSRSQSPPAPRGPEPSAEKNNRGQRSCLARTRLRDVNTSNALWLERPRLQPIRQLPDRVWQLSFEFRCRNVIHPRCPIVPRDLLECG